MNKKARLEREVKDLELREKTTVNEMISEMMAGGGFTAKNLATGIDILEEMIRDEKCVRFLSFPACLAATGVRGALKEVVKRKFFHAIITTCGTLDHDLARCWKPYFHGSFEMDDAQLHEDGINRLGNILVPNESYGIVLERKMQPILQEIWSEGKRRLATRDLIWEFGKRLHDEKSIIFWAYKNDIPIFVPGITDGAFGYQLWSFWQEHKDFVIDLFEDEKGLSDLIYEGDRTGALLVGGGISKHHTLWWNQFRGGLDYAVQLTTGTEYDGSLSGARVREGISWGKVKVRARHVTVDGDASVLLPIMIYALIDRLA